MLIFALPGCAREAHQIVPVSGEVKWKNQPLARAHVYFQPMASAGKDEPGPESYGKTDEEGKFVLKVVVLNRPGAIVGKHRVRISKLGVDVQPSSDAGGKFPRDPVPSIFNTQTTLTFEVPPEGTNQANFDLQP
jgi:hypothetical protein